METINVNAHLNGAPTPLDLAKRCRGYYECPKGPNGERLGPLVGYAGRDADEKQFVGDIYFNFAKVERHAPALRFFAGTLSDLTRNSYNEDIRKRLKESTGFCGAPEGGKALANRLADFEDKQYIFPEKKVTRVATRNYREESELVFDRHEPEKGDVYWIVEDVCNNFSTTEKLIALIESFGASVCGIICALNRSLTVDSIYNYGVTPLPVISCIRKKIPQYVQKDPFVAEDVIRGNVVWKPKNSWSDLERSMAANH